MTILITGVAGFIGSNLADYLLSNGFKVVGVDNFDNFYSKEIKERNISKARSNKNFTFFAADINKPSEMSRISAPVDIVVHLAAKTGVRPSIENPAGYIQTNITGTENVLEWMKSKGVRKMIFASSSSVYGNNEKVPFSENDAVDFPISPYAFTKKSCELLNYTYYKLYGINIINLRFFTVYGERQRPDLAIHKFVRAVSEGKPIQMYGTGETARDYTYIEDILSGIGSSIGLIKENEDIYEIINLGNSHPISLSGLIKKIGQAMHKEPIINKCPNQPGDVERTYADISKAGRLLGYNPSTGLEQGLSNFVQWFNETQKG